MSAELIKKALSAARAARITAFDAKDADSTLSAAAAGADKAWRLLNEAEGALAEALYWQATQAEEEGT